MKQLDFSNNNIDLACEWVGKFLADSGVERRETIRIKLAFEEVLLEYQSKFGINTTYTLKCSKRFSAIRVEIEVRGESFNPFERENEDGALINGLLAGVGLAPSWSYKNGKNYITFVTKKKPVSQTIKMLGAIALAVVAGLLLTLLPDNVRGVISDDFLSPVTNLFMGLISAAAGPLVFLSVLGSICSMGNMETLGRIGKKTILAIIGHILVAGVGLTFIVTLFYKVNLGGSTSSDFSSVLNLIYNIVPSNFFEPFVTGNILQVIFIAVIFGIAMLMLSSKVNGIFTIVDQLNALVKTVMEIISGMLPFAVFVIFANMISSGSLGELIGYYKMLLLILLLVVVYFVTTILWISLKKRISPVLVVKKALPTFLIAFTTASSAAAFSTNVKDANEKFGIDKKFANFGIPIGQVLFKPSEFALLVPMMLSFAKSSGIDITLAWLILAYITITLVSFSVPPVAGGSPMCFTIVFTQLGIPMELMGIAIAVDVIANFPFTAMNVTGWQLTMVDVADSLNMLDKETLYKKLKK